MKFRHVLFVMAVTACTTFVLGALLPSRLMGTPSPHSAKLSETTYERVIKTGHVRCGYTPYSVGFIREPNTGNFSGIYFDIVSELAKNLGLTVDWVEEVGWSQQIEGLTTGRYDLMCSPVSLNASRARAADFSIPFYYSPVHVWAKKGDVRFMDQNLSLNRPDVRISTIDGEQTTVFASEFFPNAKTVSLPQSAPFSDLLLQVTTGKADIVFSEPVAVNDFMTTNPDTLQRITPLDKPLLVVPNILLLPHGQYEFKEMIDNGLREMFNSGRIDYIIDKYAPSPDSYLRETTRR